ncbi:MAG: tRNA (guanosine(46)-N7)-methyltransferase TrmB [Rhizobiales bacterium]|nr:tRNA (guanosine(46)-N7)-methyltransferase TrmB [Hyphomicrobiales bacterium]
MTEDRTQGATSQLDRRQVSRRHVYGRRRGKPLRAHQAGLVEDFLPEISIDLPEGEGERLNPASLFVSAKREIWLEIGFGGGEHLIDQARTHPDIGIIGCEPFLNGIAKLVAEIDGLGLKNIRVHPDDARPLLEKLRPASLDRIFILYPDPWPKARHNKRRFINQETLATLTAALKPGGELRFASDIPDYVAWTLAHIRQFNAAGGPRLVWAATCPADWRTPYAGWCGTRYEQKALREGRTPAYLTFHRE